MIHRFRHLGDLDQPLTSVMPIGCDDVHTAYEGLEVPPLGRPERVLFEERNDPLQQIDARTHAVLELMLMMVVLPPIEEDAADTKEARELLER